MRHPALKKKLRDYRFEQLELRHVVGYLFHGVVAVISVVALLLTIFREQWPPAVFMVLAAAGLTLAGFMSMHLSRRRALDELRRELPPGEPYEAPEEIF